MERVRKFLKFWFPTFLMIGILSFSGYMVWRESEIKSSLIENALSGGSIAIAILGKYEKPWKLDEKVLKEALEGNPYALQILGIDKALIESQQTQKTFYLSA